ncbi:hypothetical protein MKX03_026081, partial [Papaver bracteatum]
MGSDEVLTNDERTHDTQSICTDQATKKLQVLQQQVYLVVQHSPQPGPATFLLQCLYVIPVFEPLYTECFSHLFTWSGVITLLECFSICQSKEEFLMRMIEEKQFKVAEKWATFVGKALVVTLINRYLDLKLLKNASDLIEKNNIKQDSLEVHHMYKKRALQKKDCGNISELRTNENKQLLEHLVYLAREAGYPEKADGLCKQYPLDGVEPQAKPTLTHFLPLKELFVGDIEQVDYPGECNVIGVDCEWKPNYVKGSKPNKVSIVQISSEKAFFILDLINLSEDEPKSLDKCLQRILHSSSILKLGYNLQCDLNQLSQSYGELEHFKNFNMLPYIQNLFKESQGGFQSLPSTTLTAFIHIICHYDTQHMLSL